MGLQPLLKSYSFIRLCGRNATSRRPVNFPPILTPCSVPMIHELISGRRIDTTVPRSTNEFTVSPNAPPYWRTIRACTLAIPSD